MNVVEPEPQSDTERAALKHPCPSCFAHAGEWCATAAARNHYTSRLHIRRLVLAWPESSEVGGL